MSQSPISDSSTLPVKGQPSICFVHQGYELYGSDRTMLQSVRAARARWPEGRITVLLPREGSLAAAMREIVDDVRITQLAVLRKSNIKTLRAGSLKRLAQRVNHAKKLVREYDLVYINTVPVLDFILAAGLSRSNAIVHVHEIPTGAAAKILPALVRFSRASVIFNSHATARAFPLAKGQRGKVIWNGYEYKTVARTEPPHDGLNILMIGRFNAWKGQTVLLRALALLSAEERARLRVRVIGSYFEEQSHFHDRLVETIQEHSLEDTVEMLKFHDDPSHLYAWADIVTVPSTAPEPFGLVAIEAMAAGCGVIAANHGGLPEIVMDGVTGKLVVPGSAEDMAAALSAYLRDKDSAQQHGVAGRQRFMEEFHESRYINRIADFIASCIPKRSSAVPATLRERRTETISGTGNASF